MSKIYDFLKENNMLMSCFDREALEKDFKDDMDNKKTMYMTDSYQTVNLDPLPSESILAIDAGGTNIRFSLFENGVFSSEEKMPMFGSEKAITGDEFFELVAAEIRKYPAKKVGFCYSYPCEILENKDGKALYITKEVKIDGLNGKVLGEEINKRLEQNRSFSVINDTVAAQLGTCADIGVILGTGFNICYTDKTTGHIINTECGQYSGFPQGVFDDKLNELIESPRPCSEKRISGAYLAPLIKITAEEYFGLDLPDFSLADVSEFIREADNKDEVSESLLSGYLTKNQQCDFLELVNEILKRAAQHVALILKCISERTKTANDVGILRIALEGSTVYKLPGYLEVFKEEVTKALDCDIEFIDARGMIRQGCLRCVM